MRNVLVGGLVLIAIACAGSNGTSDEEDDLPAVQSACRPIMPIHSSARCDGCTRDLCCPEVLGCEDDAICRGLLHCLAKCEPGDAQCGGTCKGDFTGGEPGLAVVNSCAQRQCPIACGTAYIEE